MSVGVSGNDVSGGSFMTSYAVTQPFLWLELAGSDRKSETSEGPGTEYSEELGPLFMYSFFC